VHVVRLSAHRGAHADNLDSLADAATRARIGQAPISVRSDIRFETRKVVTCLCRAALMRRCGDGVTHRNAPMPVRCSPRIRVCTSSVPS